MSRIYQNGAEWQTINEIDAVTGTIISTTQTTGNGSLASYLMSGSLATGAQYGFLALISNDTKVFFKADVYIDTLPATGDTLSIRPFDIRNPANNALLARTYIYNDSGTLKTYTQYNNNATVSATASLGVGQDEWFRLEIGMNITPTNGSRTYEVRVNGNTITRDTNLSFTTTLLSGTSTYMINSTGSSQTVAVYWDNLALNNGSGTYNNTWVGEEYIVGLVPAGAGDSNATTGTYANINEIPGTFTDTSSSDRIEIDDSTIEAWFTISSPTTYIETYDRINAIQPRVAARCETINQSVGLTTKTKSMSGGTADTKTQNIQSTTVNDYDGVVSEVDPTTGTRWKTTGTNSLTSGQMGVMNPSNSNDLWVTSMILNVAYTPGSVGNHGMLIMFW